MACERQRSGRADMRRELTNWGCYVFLATKLGISCASETTIRWPGYRHTRDAQKGRHANRYRADHREHELPGLGRHHVFDDTERRMKPGNTSRCDKGQRDQQSRPRQADQHEQALAAGQRQAGGG